MYCVVTRSKMKCSDQMDGCVCLCGRWMPSSFRGSWTWSLMSSKHRKNTPRRWAYTYGMMTFSEPLAAVVSHPTEMIKSFHDLSISYYLLDWAWLLAWCVSLFILFCRGTPHLSPSVGFTWRGRRRALSCWFRSAPCALSPFTFDSRIHRLQYRVFFCNFFVPRWS